VDNVLASVVRATHGMRLSALVHWPGASLAGIPSSLARAVR